MCSDIKVGIDNGTTCCAHQELRGQRAVNGSVEAAATTACSRDPRIASRFDALNETRLARRLREEYIPFLEQQLQSTRYLVIEHM